MLCCGVTDTLDIPIGKIIEWNASSRDALLDDKSGIVKSRRLQKCDVTATRSFLSTNDPERMTFS